ncbi:MAG: FAD-binding oxidoreductase [Gammaproteobacteria bacterium]|nr:FAD-binding oxidoreductase [Gammaproteobacteria bacterium]
MTSMASYNVIIVGGGIIGSSIAYWLAADSDFDGSVLVIERDSSYADSSTARSNSCIRQQFSTPENIQISQFGIQFIKNVGEYLSVDGETPELSFVESGYLFLANAEVEPALRESFETQKKQGVKDVIWQDVDQLQTRYPWLSTTDLVGGTLGLRNEGWFDPYSLLQAFKRKARLLGVEYIEDEVVDLLCEKNRITQVVTRNSGTLVCDNIVNAAGPRARFIAEMAGIDIHVSARKRCVFVFKSQDKVDMTPLIIDPEGMYIRREGETFICGQQPDEDNDPECLDLEVDHAFFGERLWPKLAALVPAFETIKLVSAWAGHYEMNLIDQNALLGPHPEVENLYFCNEFSGHGLQQSPAAGRAISELIVHGDYQALDLSRLSTGRLMTGDYIREIYVV